MTTLLDQLVKEAIKQQPAVSPISERENVGQNEASEQDESSGQADSVRTGGEAIDLPPANSPMGTAVEPEVFNPEIHAVNEDGSPVLKKGGGYAKKKGRKRGTLNNPQTVSHGSIPNTDEMRTQKSYAAAVATVQTILILGSVIGGAEFTPIVDVEKGINEPKMLTDAWTQYYMTTDVEGVPPWFGVLIATGSYFAIRMTMPKTQSRMSVAWDWVKSWFVDVPATPLKMVQQKQPESTEEKAA